MNNAIIHNSLLTLRPLRSSDYTVYAARYGRQNPRPARTLDTHRALSEIFNEGHIEDNYLYYLILNGY